MTTNEPKDRIDLFRIEQSEQILIPLFTGTGLHAGFPSPAMDYLQESIDLNQLLISNRSATFVANIEGDSMIDAFVANPCKAIIDRSVTPANNDIIIALVNKEFIVRYFTKRDGVVTLKPANKKKNYQPTVITEGMEFEVWGVITQILIDPRVVGFYDRFS